MDTIDYEIRRSARRTLALEVTPEARVLVRAPFGLPDAEIARFVAAHAAWLSRHLAQAQRRLAAHPEPSPDDAAMLRRRAEAELPPLVGRYGAQMGLRPTSVRITGARTRFGSCSAKNAICFSWWLMQYPREAIEYVVVHELAHIQHKHHGSAFYDCVASVLPDWQARRALLRE